MNPGTTNPTPKFMRVPTVQGGQTVRVRHAENGLAVTPGVASYTGVYVVTHMRSGYMVPGVWRATLRSARAVLRRLLKAGDWQRTIEEMQADIEFWKRAEAAVVKEQE